jgi:hypothetical protein
MTVRELMAVLLICGLIVSFFLVLEAWDLD